MLIDSSRAVLNNRSLISWDDMVSTSFLVWDVDGLTAGIWLLLYPFSVVLSTVFINQVNIKTGKAADIFTAMYLINMTSNGVYNNQYHPTGHR